MTGLRNHRRPIAASVPMTEQPNRCTPLSSTFELTTTEPGDGRTILSKAASPTTGALTPAFARFAADHETVPGGRIRKAPARSWKRIDR